MTKLLLDERPLIVLPELAVQVGLNEAILLQQIHYWINQKNNLRDGRYWVYNTLKELNDQFPFWSQKTIQRTITSLKKKEVLLTANYNKAGFDKTVWYSIDYEQLDFLVSNRYGQNDHTRESYCPNGNGQNDHTNTLDFTKTSTKNITTTAADNSRVVTNEVNAFDHYQQEIGMLSPYISELIDVWLTDLDNQHEIICFAINIAVSRNGRNWALVESILKDWINKGAKTLSDCQSLQKEFENRGDRNGNSSKIRRGRAQQSKSQNGTERVGRM
ncbi:DnaD domain-containing protein [Cytobacillus kochii]|uniref:DnaB/C C-terminal domain-containing protein n=1 Tax=Cytobacillus kochii TaxID=859143 RepID=A0A248THF0_9BACI|nr:DnaD domain protein [Cytobacillus kochii]ASV67605.1 hypothetical protein CKF48_09885 [Cytobacillus kochii]